MNYISSAILAVAGGLIPCFLWLGFWLREDKAHPEPRPRIIESFGGGILCILLVYPLEGLARQLFGSPSTPTPGLFFAWATIEELLKFGACYYIALRSKDDDEPIDAVIYMIITALGFAALENSLYIYDQLYHFSDGVGAMVLGNYRFVGSTLLHILTSSIVGIFIAFSFYKPKIHKKISVVMGLFFAIIIHTLFNVLVSSNESAGSLFLLAFPAVWWGIIAVIIVLEKIKLLHPTFNTLHESALMEVDPRLE